MIIIVTLPLIKDVIYYQLSNWKKMFILLISLTTLYGEKNSIREIHYSKDCALCKYRDWQTH